MLEVRTLGMPRLEESVVAPSYQLEGRLGSARGHQLPNICVGTVLTVHTARRSLSSTFLRETRTILTLSCMADPMRTLGLRD